MFKKLWFSELYSVYWEYNKNDIESHLFLDNNNAIKWNNFELTIRKQYFDFIKNWQKTVEWRSWKQFLNYKIWDKIIFLNWWNKVERIITWIIRYNNLKDFLENEWIKNCLPWIKNIEEWVKIYNSIPWYKEKIKKFWIIAIQF